MKGYRVMCITAHPDDECGGFGGALMRAKQRGAETSVLCLTEGRAASYRGETKSEDELAEVRREEFFAALQVLGVDHGKVLQYPDGHLVQANFLAMTTEVVGYIRQFRPQVVMTFGGDGGVNLHPDHMMASFIATAAFYWAGNETFHPEQTENGLLPYRPHKLYYSSPSFLVHKGVEVREKWAHVPASLALSVEDLKHRKYQAFEQHQTQAPLLEKIRDVFKRSAGEERYLLAGAQGQAVPFPETDMLAGVVPDDGSANASWPQD